MFLTFHPMLNIGSGKEGRKNIIAHARNEGISPNSRPFFETEPENIKSVYSTGTASMMDQVERRG